MRSASSQRAAPAVRSVVRHTSCALPPTHRPHPSCRASSRRTQRSRRQRRRRPARSAARTDGPRAHVPGLRLAARRAGGAGGRRRHARTRRWPGARACVARPARAAVCDHRSNRSVCPICVTGVVSAAPRTRGDSHTSSQRPRGESSLPTPQTLRRRSIAAAPTGCRCASNSAFVCS